MTKKFKKLKRQASDLTSDQQSLMAQFKDDVEMLLESGGMELDNLPEGRSPSPNLQNSVKELTKKITDGLEAEEIELDEFPEYQKLLKFDIAVRNSTLKYEVKKIAGADKLNAVEEFYTLHNLYRGIPEDEQEQLEEQYILAVRALYKHSSFMESLSSQSDEMGKVIVTDHKNKGSIKRNQAKIFLEGYEKHRILNPQLGRDKVFCDMMAEVEAILYLQRQSDSLKAGKIEVKEDLVNYVNRWIDYLNELSDEEMEEKVALHGEVEYCARLIDAE